MSFPHIVLIFLIALVVLGPQKMPKLVAQVGRWAGKARAMARQFREQLESEINLEELNRTASKPVTPTTPAPDTLHPAPWSQSTPDATQATAPEPEATPAPMTTSVEPLVATTSEPHLTAEAASAPEAAPAPAWVSDVHDHRLHPAAPPETHSPTPIIETHERGV